MEEKVGIELFYTDTPGVGGRLKKYPEDFVVKEILEMDFTDDGEGYTIARVISRNWETNRLVKELARRLNIDRDKIAFAGTKDKRAITEQWMSFETEPKKVEKLDIRRVEIKDIQTSHRSLHIGAHRGNGFEVMIRDMEVDEQEVIERESSTGEKIKEKGGFANWFGLQRFGIIRPITHEVGKKIVEGDYQGAVNKYVANPIDGEDEECYQARKFLEDTWDIEEALDRYPEALTFEKGMLRKLREDQDDYVSALRSLPHNLLMMFVHAYQSYLFNRIVSERLKRGIPIDDVRVGDIILPTKRNGLPNKDTPVDVTEDNVDKVSKMVKRGKAFVSAPLFGYHSRFSEGEQGEIEREIIVEEEDVLREDFVIPEISSISSTGSRREMFAPVRDLDWKMEGGGLNLSFELNKGSYATTLLREFMKLPPEQVKNYS